MIDFPLVNDELALLWMVNMGCIDMNTWYSRVDQPDRPDCVLFDLDPSPDVGFAETIEVALLVKQMLDLLELESLPEDERLARGSTCSSRSRGGTPTTRRASSPRSSPARSRARIPGSRRPSGRRLLVAAAAELAAGVERREHERDRRDLLDRVLVDGDAAAVVDDPHAAVGLQRHFDVGGVAGEGFVDRVVDDLVDEVVEPALTRGADVHARPLAHGLQTLEKLDVAGIVRGIRGNGRLIGGLGHHSSIRAIVCVSATACLCRTT